jgi:PncC family amidohydrolase
MGCEVCLWEKVRRGNLLRVFGEDPKRIREILKGIPSSLEEGPAGVDVVFKSDEDLREAESRLGRLVYSKGESMEEVVGRLLRGRGFTLSVAESCTGGLLAARIVNVPGSSAYFLGGVVVYSNELKVKLLGVKEETLRSFGAVSDRTCLEMLEGLKRNFGTDCGIAITGIAGPGGTEGKPEGLTYIGVYVKERTRVERHVFSMGRNKNRFLSTQTALNVLRNMLEELR